MFLKLFFTITLGTALLTNQTIQPNQPTEINCTKSTTHTISKQQLRLLSCCLSTAAFATSFYAGLQNPNYQPQCLLAMFFSACTFSYSACECATNALIQHRHGTCIQDAPSNSI